MRTQNVNYPSYTNFGQNQILCLSTKERSTMTNLIHFFQKAKAAETLQFDYYTPVVLEKKPENYILMLAKDAPLSILKGMNEAAENASTASTPEERNNNISLFKELKKKLMQAQADSDVIEITGMRGLVKKLREKGFDLFPQKKAKS